MDIIKITDETTNVIARYADDFSVEQMRALPLLAFGMTPHKVAETLLVPYQTVLTWQRTNEKFRVAITELRGAVTDYHKDMLNQAATLAWDRIFEFLGKEFDETDRDNRGVQARLAQFVISELGLKETKIKMQDEPRTIRVEDNSMEILARKISELNAQNTTYRISGPTVNEDERYNSRQTATLVDMKEHITDDEFAETKELYAHHKDTEYGKVSIEDDNFICHICGERTLDLIVHIRAAHNLSGARYRSMYNIPSDVKLYMETKKEEIIDAELS